MCHRWVCNREVGQLYFYVSAWSRWPISPYPFNRPCNWFSMHMWANDHARFASRFGVDETLPPKSPDELRRSWMFVREYSLRRRRKIRMSGGMSQANIFLPGCSGSALVHSYSWPMYIERIILRLALAKMEERFSDEQLVYLRERK